MPLSSYSHSAHYTYLDHALRARWGPCKTLAEEMAAFVPDSEEAFKPAREAEVQRLQALNPDKSSQELENFVSHQFALTASPDLQFHRRFDERHMSEYVAVTMLAHALVEALANALLAIGLAEAESVELFPTLERADFKDKWLVGPKSFSATYSFPRGTGLHETLTMLSKQRNALVHSKIDLEVGGQRVLEGSSFKRQAYDDEQRWLLRFFSLPYDLMAFARKAIPHAPLLLVGREPIPVASAHVGT